ncbi:MAG TPA: 2-hydroxychromene-2-carboxylate isomerase [Burkholderiaceae bacterium]|nr:2-hydroxychromene-2-carboxylate isomerase [Burkholderiaceae bacterium]
MSLVVDYYFSPVSPWTYLGHDRFIAIAQAAGARIEPRPIDLGQVFPATGGLPLPKRAPQRQAYRLVELQRFSAHLGVPLNLHPKHFPAPADAAARLIVAVAQHDGSESAVTLAGALLRAVWAEERNIADAATLRELLTANALPAQRLDDSQSDAVRSRFQADTERAIEIGVFGAPAYVVDGEVFWGQDRLDFVQRRLQRG